MVSEIIEKLFSKKCIFFGISRNFPRVFFFCSYRGTSPIRDRGEVSHKRGFGDSFRKQENSPLKACFSSRSWGFHGFSPEIGCHPEKWINDQIFVHSKAPTSDQKRFLRARYPCTRIPTCAYRRIGRSGTASTFDSSQGHPLDGTTRLCTPRIAIALHAFHFRYTTWLSPGL